MTDISPDMDKPALRRAMRAARKAYVANMAGELRARQEMALRDALLPLLDNASAVGLYCAVGSEIALGPVETMVADHRKMAAYPRMQPDTAGFDFAAGACLATGPQGIAEPAADAPIILPDLVLVPLLAIDAVGTRLGQGGGHYDRVLPALRDAGATIVGVGWDFQRLDFPLPREEWDVALGGFASPQGLEMFA